MSQLRFFKIIIVVLIVLNVVVLTFLLSDRGNSHRPPPPHHPPHRFLMEAVHIMNLDDSQTELFKKLTEKHNRQMDSINQVQSKLLVNYFEKEDLEIHHEQFEKYKDLEGEKLSLTKQHFLEVREILREDQLDNYRLFVEKATQILVIKKNPRHPPKDF